MSEGDKIRKDGQARPAKDITAGHQPIKEGYQPQGEIRKGYQPQGSTQPVGQNPPSGPSAVSGVIPPSPANTGQANPAPSQAAGPAPTAAETTPRPTASASDGNPPPHKTD